MEDPRNRAVTSTLTMTEILVGPYKSGEEARATAYFGLLSQYPHLEWIAPELEIAEAAARLRGRYGLRTVDALQVATAIHSKATCIIGNDVSFRRVTELEAILLDDYT
jgi:predicted nucleic acid-binding protein